MRQRGSYGRKRSGGLGSVINSNKNMVNISNASVANTLITFDIADTQDSATLAVADDVQRGCKIFRVYLEFWVIGTQSSGVNNFVDCYIFKNPGSNLTPPNPGTEGTSNEKKFIFKKWKGLLGKNTEGTPFYSFRGWIKVPKVYQRMGANDKLQFLLITPQNGLHCISAIYKWYI